MNKFLIIFLITGLIFLIVAFVANQIKKPENNIEGLIKTNEDFYQKVSYLKVGAAGTQNDPKGIAVDVRYYDKDNNLISFKDLNIPAKITLFGETAVGWDENNNKAKTEKIILYEKDLIITESKKILEPLVFIPNQEIKYYTDSIFGSVEIIKPDGIKIKDEQVGFIGGKVIFPNEMKTSNQAMPLVDIKINGSDGPVYIPINSPFQLTWQGNNVKSCGLFGPNHNAVGFYDMNDQEFLLNRFFTAPSSSEKVIMHGPAHVSFEEVKTTANRLGVELTLQCQDFSGKTIKDNVKIILK